MHNSKELENLNINIDEVCSVLKSNFPNANLKRVVQAYTFANEAHKNQFRHTGEEYIIHPLFVAYLCAYIRLDEASVIAALLHDTVEDTHVSLDEIKSLYGEDATFLVDGLTKIKNVSKKVGKLNNDFESARKLLIASTKDVRVILIKLADRLHNIITIQGLSPERQKSFATETLKLYAPMADFVGVYYFRSKLEDFSFKVINPQVYSEIEKYLINNKLNIGEREVSRDEYISYMIEHFKKLLKDNRIKAQVFGRNKGIYSIYKKIIKLKKEYDISFIKDVNDLVGITILTNSIPECYKTLGLFHANFDYIKNVFDDYIAKPKDNGYRSIHSCLVDEKKIKIALQIKTFKMQEYNEYGPASHIYYKHKNNEGFFPYKILNTQISFLKKLVRWKEEIQDVEHYKVDVLKDKVFVLTPLKEVKELPNGATALDFAYLIHTNVGNSCKGVKVNGAIKPLNYTLVTGDVVEILVDKRKHKPSRDWLSFVHTNYARNIIQKVLRGEDKIEHPEHAEEEIIVPASVAQKKGKQKGVSDERDLSVRIKGVDNIEYSIAKCCSPIPGDDIIAHVTKTRGIRIHSAHCSELEALDYKVLLESLWVSTKKDFKAGILIKGKDNSNNYIMEHLTKILDDFKITMDNCDIWNNNGFNSKIVLNVKSKNDLNKLINKLKRIKYIKSVERVNIN